MKRFTIILSALLFCVAASAQEPQFADNKVISHRGAWKNTGHPQNSLASFRAAAEMGCHGSECDVHLTLDDSLVIYHDLSHAGMLIEKTNYADLVKVPLKNGEKIPTLREYIIRAKQYPRTKLIIDVKTPQETARATRIALAAAKEVKAMNFEQSVEYLLGYLPAVEALAKVTNCPMAYLGRWKVELPEMHPDTIANRKIRFLDYQDVHYKNHPEWIETFKARGIHLNAWTINSEADMDWFLEHDFDYITTDYPERLLEKCAELKKK
ncbi:MAG: hypothetical protein IKY82_01110 [Alistipes sp.]|nr:hypothetical protein [Alistipes sp.]